MEQPLANGTATPGRGEAVTSGAATAQEKGHDPGKILILSKKTRNIPRSVRGCPEIASPWQKKKYELQMSFFTARFLKMLEWAGYDEKEGRERRKTGHEVRGELQTFLRNGIDRLLDLALREKDANAKDWAGALLANISVRIEKYDKKLSEVNAVYCDEKKKIGKLRTDVLFPKPIGAAVKRELRKAERYRKRLMYFKTGYGEEWKAAVSRHNRQSRQKITEAYWPFAELLEFSVKSEPQWWKLLWPLLKKNNPDLLEKLRGDAKRKEVVWTHLDGSSKWQVKSRKLFWKDFQKQFRNHLKALAGQGVR
jgi:hypothetical protein